MSVKRTKADLEEENARLRNRVVTLEIRDVEKTAALNVYRDMYEKGLVDEMKETEMNGTESAARREG